MSEICFEVLRFDINIRVHQGNPSTGVLCWVQLHLSRLSWNYSRMLWLGRVGVWLLGSLVPHRKAGSSEGQGLQPFRVVRLSHPKCLFPAE
jgi:hypothetical protein